MPWDQRFARLAMRPLVGTALHPNHITALSFLAGLGTAILFADGGRSAANWAAGLFMLVMFLDHSDGELARQSGKTSQLGHRLDYIVGSANYAMLFVGMGVGFASSIGGDWLLVLGLCAGFANPVIVGLRMTLERRRGAQAVRHPSAVGFEIEDFVYLIGPITWLGGSAYFFIAFGMGTIGYLIWTLMRLLRPRREV